MNDKDLTTKLTKNKFTLGVIVDKSNCIMYYETATIPYVQNSRLNPSYSNLKTGNELIKWQNR